MLIIMVFGISGDRVLTDSRCVQRRTLFDHQWRPSAMQSRVRREQLGNLADPS